MKKADNFNAKQWLVENKVTFQSRLNETIDFPEMEDEFMGAMEAGDQTKEEYLQDIIRANPNQLISDAYYEVLNAVEQGIYTKPEAVKLMKAWAKEKLGSYLNEAKKPSIKILKDIYYFDKLSGLGTKDDVDEKYHDDAKLVFKKGKTIKDDTDYDDSDYETIISSSRLTKGTDYSI